MNFSRTSSIESLYHKANSQMTLTEKMDRCNVITKIPRLSRKARQIDRLETKEKEAEPIRCVSTNGRGCPLAFKIRLLSIYTKAFHS